MPVLSENDGGQARYEKVDHVYNLKTKEKDIKNPAMANRAISSKRGASEMENEERIM